MLNVTMTASRKHNHAAAVAAIIAYKLTEIGLPRPASRQNWQDSST
jgi:hypothetical protein